MPSPFPGMDPWLEAEAEWGGFHQAYVVAIQAELNRHLPAGYRARIDEYIWVQDEPDDRRRQFKPDAFVPEPTTPGVAVAARPTTAPTHRGRLAARRRKARYVAVTGPGRRVLTVVEVLSPANKAPGPDRDAYLAKRREFLAAANLVEVDLLRAGHRPPAGMPPPPPSDYAVFVGRAEAFPEVEVWAVSVRDPLPVLPVPLDAGRPDCPLDLRACLDRVYDDGRYAETAGYDAPPDPPLRPADAEWAAELLKQPARRRTPPAGG